MQSEERIQCQALSYFSVTLSFSRLISSAEKRYFVTLLMIFCSVPTELGAVFTKSFCAAGLRLGPECVKEPQTGLSHQTASPISQWPRSVITPCWYFHAIQGQLELFIELE